MSIFLREDLVNMNTTDKIYVAGHKGLVGSALVRALREQGYTNLVLRTREELDLTHFYDVEKFFQTEKPDYVFLSAARSGCVIVSPPLPSTDIYKNSNVVQVKNWHTDAGPVIMELVGDNDKLISIQRSIQDDWKNTLCEKAAANRILSKLQ